MLVSVIIPTFNRSALIVRAIESVLKQSYENIEIIVIDDGSTDDTESIISEIMKKRTSVKYFKKINGGCASARNFGINCARGEFIAFLDSDDCWLPNAIELMLTALINSNADFVYSPAIEKYSNSYEEVNFPVASGEPEKFAIKHFKNTNTRSGALLYRRKIFNVVKGFDENLRYNEDSDFLQCVAVNFKAEYLAIPTVIVYHHDSNKSKNRIEILKSLLISSQRILVEYPHFASQLGHEADIRIRQIKKQLVQEYIFSGNFFEANSIGIDIIRNLPVKFRIALFFKNNIILKIELLLRRTVSTIIRVFAYGNSGKNGKPIRRGK